MYVTCTCSSTYVVVSMRVYVRHLYVVCTYSYTYVGGGAGIDVESLELLEAGLKQSL